MKVSLLQGFPYTAPVISCMARVTHPNVERNTYAYKGPQIQNWTQNSNLTAIVKAIHEEFKTNPPMPEGVSQPAGGVAQQQPATQFENKQERYSGETVILQKPFLTELKKKVMAMDANEIQSLSENTNMLRDLYFNQPEVEKITREVNRLVKDVSDQTNENLQERHQISEMLEQYDTKFA